MRKILMVVLHTDTTPDHPIAIDVTGDDCFQNRMPPTVVRHRGGVFSYDRHDRQKEEYHYMQIDVYEL